MAYDSLSPANSASNTDTDTKSLAKRFLVPALGLTMISAAGCSFKKNKDEDKAQNVTVITKEAPTADNIAQAEFETEMIPGEFGLYTTKITWPKGKRVKVEFELIKAVKSSESEGASAMSGQNTFRDLVDAETQNEIEFPCPSDAVYILGIKVLSKDISGIGTNLKSDLVCPTDLHVIGEKTNPATIHAISAITGRLKLAPNAQIITNKPLELKATEIISEGVATISVIRNRMTYHPDPNFKVFPLKLVQSLSNEPDLLPSRLEEIRHKGVPFSELAMFNNWPERKNHLRFSSPTSLKYFYASETGLQWIEKFDNETPHLKIKAKKITGTIIIKLEGENGRDAVSASDVASNGTSAYASLLKAFPARNGNPGRIASHSEKCRPGRGADPMPFCQVVCTANPSNGENGEDGKIPGLDGFDGADGMPSPAASIEIQDSTQAKIEFRIKPGFGGRGSAPTAGQQGGIGGAPGANPGKPKLCSDAQPGTNGKHAPSGNPGREGAPGFCGAITLKGKNLYSDSHIRLVDDNSLATRCLREKNPVTVVD